MTIDAVTQWGAVLVSLIAIAYGVVLIIRGKGISSAPPETGPAYFIWPVIISALIAGLTILSLTFLDLKSGVYYALIIGWVLMLVLAAANLTTSRKLDVETDIVSGYYLISAMGILACASAILAIVLVQAFFLSKDIAKIFLATVIGFWIALTFVSLPDTLRRNLADGNDAKAGLPGAVTGGVSSETAFLIAAGLAVAASMATFHFKAENVSGMLYPFGVFGASLFFGMLSIPLLKPVPSGEPILFRRVARWWLGITIFLAGTGLTAYYLATTAVADIQVFYCFGIGLLTAMLLMLIARYRPPFAGTGSPFKVEIAVAEILMILAAAVLSFLWAGGYGISLCAAGILAAFPVLLQSGALWASRRIENNRNDSDITLMAGAATRFSEIITAGGAFVIILSLLRLYLEQANLTRTGIDISEPYPLIGLVIGGSLPIVLRALMLSSRSTVPTVQGVRIGRWASVRILGIWLLAVATPLLAAFFWRYEAVGAYLVGLAAAELFLILTLWLGEVRNTVDDGMRVTTRITHITSVGSGLIAVLFVPYIIAFTSGLTRMDKIKGLIVVMAVIFVWILIVVWRRLAGRGRSDVV